jgi:D-alanine-D-alanine ligase
MRIGLTFNLKPPGASGDEYEEFDSEETIAALEAAIAANGHTPIRLGWGAEMLDRLAATPVDGVFNIAEGMGGRGRESQVPALLEMFGIPCSGSSPLAIALTLDKAMAKRVAVANGIATASFYVTLGARVSSPAPSWAAGRRSSAGEDTRAPNFPLFAKPANEGSSMGITAASLCRDQAQLDAAIERLSKYGPVLVEEFLSGDEYTVGIIDGEVLGAMQVVPKKKEENFIYSLDVKRDYLNRVEYRLVNAKDVERVALEVWKAFGLRDVARVDIRRDRHGVPNFVEVNPLPGVHPVNSDLIILARLRGLSHQEVIGMVIDAAMTRWACE